MEGNRSILETLKFLSASDILLHTSLVSQHWHRLSQTSEIWHYFCDSESITSEEIACYNHNPKLAYADLINVTILKQVILSGGGISLFDCKTRKVEMTSRSLKVNSTCSAVMIRNTQVMFTGGQDEYNRAVLYDFALNLHDDFPELLNPRRYHASVHIRRTVYVFGGDCSNGNTAEKCSLPLRTWKHLPSMPRQRSAFSPCTHKDLIYLCGGNVPASETFHIKTERYESLPFQLPVGSWCVASFLDDNLILENQQYRSVWNPVEGLRTNKVQRGLTV